jgi:glutamate/tyrosine decarboxylase-like PLP-dependent enzyme
VLVSGGSAATMTALACAREALIGPMTDDVIAYCSDQAHSSVARAARILGFRPDQMRVLPSDERYRLRPDVLAAAMDADLAAGRRPLFAVASAGTTGTGAVDPIRALAGVAADRGAWLHVDGAYGGFAVLDARGRRWLDGIELADSITLDPHKWLYQPFECGCVLVRDGARLDDAFAIAPEYLREVSEVSQREVNFADRGFQLTRASRAIKLWLSLRYFGADAFRRAVSRSLDLAEHAQRLIERSDRLELLLPASLGIVCFRRRAEEPDDEDAAAARNARLVDELMRSGVGMVSSTRLRGRYAIRMCIMNHTTGAADVERVIGWFETAEVPERPAAPVAAPVVRERHPPAAVVRLERDRVDADGLAALPLFASLDRDQRERLAHTARVAIHGPGEVIARQWDAARDFYVIAEGTVEVTRNGEHVREMGPGEFFGELAALEWGAGFGYPRLATVVARSPVRAVVLASEPFNALLREAPALAAEVRETAAARLTHDV